MLLVFLACRRTIKHMTELERLAALLEAAERNVADAPKGTLEQCLEKCLTAEERVMGLPKLGTKTVKGMLIHHATTQLGWTRDEISGAFNEWFAGCSGHRERVEPNFTDQADGSTK